MSKHHARLHAKRWQAMRRVVLERAGYRCTSCGKSGRLEVDHITPIQRETGQNPYDINGLQALCRACHFAKSATEARKYALTDDEIAWRKLVLEMMPLRAI